jgi:outer membrane protein assembly factor BamB
VSALRADTGQILWRVHPARAAIQTLVAGAGDVYAVASSYANNVSDLYALQASDGSLLWHWQSPSPSGGVGQSGVPADGAVYVGTFDRQVRAFAGRTGAQHWQYQAGGPIDAPVAVAAGTVFVGVRNGSLDALDAATGALRWRYQASSDPNAFTGRPVMAEGVVFFGVGVAHPPALPSVVCICAVKARDGSLLWSQAGRDATYG